MGTQRLICFRPFLLTPDHFFSYSLKYVTLLFLAVEADILTTPQNELEEDGEPDNRLLNLQNILPLDILARASSLSLSPLNTHSSVTLSALYPYLPPVDLAMNLRTTYYTHAAWM
jgi:hypothetical protein